MGIARGYDIVMWQETKLTASDTANLRLKWCNPQVFLSTIGHAARGTVTMFSARLDAQHLDHHSDTLGQYIVNIISVRGETILVANVYRDACTDLNSFNAMTRLNTTIELFAGQYGIDHFLIGGDYNFVLHPADSRSTSSKICYAL